MNSLLNSQTQKQRRIKLNIPNLLTLVRFLLIPVMAVFLFKEDLLLALIIYTIASITDIIDGFVARKFNMITNLGKVLDPLADKLLQFTALIGLSYIDIIPYWIVVIFATKEILMGLGAIKLLKKDIVVQAKWFGKVSTCLFFLAIIVAMLSRIFNIPEIYPVMLMCFALLMTFFSLVMYLLNYIKVSKQTKTVD